LPFYIDDLSRLSVSSSTTSLESSTKEKPPHHEEDALEQKKLKLFESPLAHDRAKSILAERPESASK
jgi:hypothetical protein